MVSASYILLSIIIALLQRPIPETFIDNQLCHNAHAHDFQEVSSLLRAVQWISTVKLCGMNKYGMGHSLTTSTAVKSRDSTFHTHTFGEIWIHTYHS